MKQTVNKWVVLFLFVAFASAASAQADWSVKVTNVRSSRGKVMAATDKGQLFLCVERKSR